jgi:FkbM family methyltransferase
MLGHLKRLLKRTARSMGVELTRYVPEASETARIQALLAGYQIDLVLDVGANTGQYAQLLREGGYRGKIVSFEPLASAHQELIQNSRSDPSWVIAPKVAIGAEAGEAVIHVSENSVSSSLLPMLPRHLSAAPESRYQSTEIVTVAPLDLVARDHIDLSSRIYLKADTQGYEGQVLKGASLTLGKARVIQLELSLLPLYSGQPLFVDMIEKLRGLGFELFSVLPGFTEPGTGRLLQFDGIFTRREERQPANAKCE